MLRGMICKPEVFTSGLPAITFGFVSLIELFEKLPPDIYDCISCGIWPLDREVSVFAIYQSLATALPFLGEVSETQKIDIVVTRSWLQTRLWRICFNSIPAQVLPTSVPATAGKSILRLLSSASQNSRDAHGIGMV